MSGLGEWDDGTPVVDEPAQGVAGQVADTIGALDVSGIAGGLVAATVGAEIQRQVKRTVAPVVEEAVAQVLTPDRLDAIALAAQ